MECFFILNCLREVGDSVEDHGLGLDVRREQSAGLDPEILAREYVTEVHTWTIDLDLLEVERDVNVGIAFVQQRHGKVTVGELTSPDLVNAERAVSVSGYTEGVLVNGNHFRIQEKLPKFRFHST
mmetsp:Transcript_16509/g.26822  ORF Transcript_16509/g.26822 Transcript_16509/m.26822 type:complete len:125 (-) Transcript_16509:487-861(-)